MAWITRDKKLYDNDRGAILLWKSKPQRDEVYFIWIGDREHYVESFELTESFCNAILGYVPKWEDEPIEIEIEIKTKED